MRQSAVTFKAKGLNFEGVIATPDDTKEKLPGVGICHPHPLHGGNMDNNVVLAVSFGLVEKGCAVFRFNFRGVGNSEGEHTRGEKEYEEALGALEFMKAWDQVDRNKLGICGYSFGTRVILNSPELQKHPKVFAFVSPSFDALEGSTLKRNKRPKFVITGNRDRLVGSEGLDTMWETFDPKPEFQVIDGADHFWMGMEPKMADPVSEFFADNL